MDDCSPSRQLAACSQCSPGILVHQFDAAGMLGARDAWRGAFATMAIITIILPVYNEAWLIGSVMTQVAEYAQNHPETRFLLVDDCSSDKTPQIISKRLSKIEHDRISMLRHETNMGKAEAIMTGLHHCTDHLVCFTDGDLAYPLNHIDMLIEALQDADVAIGSRALAGTSQRNISWRRRLYGELFNRLVRLTLSIPHRDTQAGLKGFRIEAATRLFGQLKTRNFAFDAELLFLAKKEHMRIAEIPATVSTRHSYKASTMNMLRDPITMLWSVLKVRILHVCRRSSNINMIVESKSNDNSACRQEIVSPAANLERSSEETVV